MQDDFVAFAKDYVLFAHVTTQVETDKYQNLLSEKGGQGFPHIVFMDSEGNVIAKHESARNAQAFGETGKKAKSFLEMKAKAATGDKDAVIEYTLQSLEMGSLGADAALEALKKNGKKLTKPQKVRFEKARADVAVREVLESIKGREDQQRAMETFYSWMKEGRRDPSSPEMMNYYCQLAMMEAEKQKDAATFEKALGRLKDLFGDNPRAKKFFDAQADRLNKLKEEGEKK